MAITFNSRLDLGRLGHTYTQHLRAGRARRDLDPDGRVSSGVDADRGVEGTAPASVGCVTAFSRSHGGPATVSVTRERAGLWRHDQRLTRQSATTRPTSTRLLDRGHEHQPRSGLGLGVGWSHGADPTTAPRRGYQRRSRRASEQPDGSTRGSAEHQTDSCRGLRPRRQARRTPTSVETLEGSRTRRLPRRGRTDRMDTRMTCPPTTLGFAHGYPQTRPWCREQADTGVQSRGHNRRTRLPGGPVPVPVAVQRPVGHRGGVEPSDRAHSALPPGIQRGRTGSGCSSTSFTGSCGKAARSRFTCPYAKADRAFWDPSHTRYIHEVNFYYLSPEWLLAQGLEHYPITANFEIVTIDGQGVPDDIMNRNTEMQQLARSYYWNAVTDLTIHV